MCCSAHPHVRHFRQNRRCQTTQTYANARTYCIEKKREHLDALLADNIPDHMLMILRHAACRIDARIIRFKHARKNAVPRGTYALH